MTTTTPPITEHDYIELDHTDEYTLRTISRCDLVSAVACGLSLVALVVHGIAGTRTTAAVWLGSLALWGFASLVGMLVTRGATSRFASRYNDGSNSPIGIGGVRPELIALRGVAYRRVR